MPSAPTLRCRSTGHNRRDEIRAAARSLHRRGSHQGLLMQHAECRDSEIQARRSSFPDILQRSPSKMKKKNEDQHNGHVKTNTGSVTSYSSLTPYKTGILAFLAVTGTAIILNDFGFISLEHVRTRVSKWTSKFGTNSVGGWRLADAKTLEKYGTDLCGVDKFYADELTLEKFEKDYRLKKPLILRFREGVSEWTDPEKWTLENLKSKYGEWTLYSGNSLELVRHGGNGYIGSSFAEYVDSIMRENNQNQEIPYVFDRGFYQETDLPKSLKLPPYLSIDKTKDDSLFFLGSSGTGVSFHNHADAWNAVIFGRKRWFLYNIDHTPPGGVYPGFTQLDWYQRVYPKLAADNRPIECVQGPGEIIYLPEGMYHGTINLGDTVALGIQKIQPSTKAMQLIYDENTLRKGEDATILKRIELIHQLLDLYPESAEIHMRLGALYETTNQLEEAELYCQQALNMDPYFIMAYLTLAEVKGKLGKDDEAEKLLKMVLELNPRLWDVYAKYGMFLKHRERFQEAADIFRQGIAVDPMQTPFYFYLHEMETKLGNMEAAQEAQEQLRRIQEQDVGGT